MKNFALFVTTGLIEGFGLVVQYSVDLIFPQPA
jgi:hypothetical protein